MPAHKLKVIAAKSKTKPHEILVHGPIGKSFWSDEGISALEFIHALDEIPRGEKVIIGINSQGGGVGEGLSMFNAIARRAEDVTARVDGYALSIASFFPLAASKVISPKSSIWMIHYSWAFAQGNAIQMREAAEMLDVHDQTLVTEYVRKTGKSEKEIRKALETETWMTGAEAVEYGLADEESDQDIDDDALAMIDLTPALDGRTGFPQFQRAAAFCFPGRVLGQSRNRNTSAVTGGATPTDSMNKAKILALLRKHGIQVADDATNAQIRAAINSLPETVTERAEAVTWAATLPIDNPATPPTPAAAVPAPAATNPANGQPAAGASPEIVDITARLQRTERQLDAARRQNMTRAIDELIANAQLPGARREQFIARAMADETVLDDYRAMPSRPPGGEPLRSDVSIIAENGIDLGRQFVALRGAERGAFYAEHRNRIRHAVMATNTISTDLQRPTLLQEAVMAFAPMLAPLSAFSTVFANVPLQGTDEIVVPYFALDSTTSSDFNGTYAAGDTTIASRKISVNKRKYQGLSFTSSELRRQPFLKLEEVAKLKAQKLAEDIFADVLSVVVLATYTQAITAVAANAFTSDNVADIRILANQLHWPKSGRSLMLDSAYDGALLKDSSIKAADSFGGSEAIRQGRVPVLMGFDYFETPSIPANSENLKGMAVYKSAILVGMSPIQPTPDVQKLLTSYEVYTDPKLGISFEFRSWGAPTTDNTVQIIEANYGYLAGEAKAIIRIPAA